MTTTPSILESDWSSLEHALMSLKNISAASLRSETPTSAICQFKTGDRSSRPPEAKQLKAASVVPMSVSAVVKGLRWCPAGLRVFACPGRVSCPFFFVAFPEVLA
jgi:hypothetical protein